MKFVTVTLFSILLIGCASMINTTYQSHGTTYLPTENIQFALIKGKFEMGDQTQSQIALVDPSSLRIGTFESVITGHLLKNSISTISLEEYSKFTEDQINKCIIVEWGVSGRNSQGIHGAYSQEVTVIIRRASSKELVYQGIGEYIGQTEIDDIKGALFAALKNFKR